MVRSEHESSARGSRNGLSHTHVWVHLSKTHKIPCHGQSTAVPTTLQTYIYKKEKEITNNCRPRPPLYKHTSARYLLTSIIEFVSHHFIVSFVVFLRTKIRASLASHFTPLRCCRAFIDVSIHRNERWFSWRYEHKHAPSIIGPSHYIDTMYPFAGSNVRWMPQ